MVYVDPNANDVVLDGVEPVLITAGQVASMIQVSSRTLWRMLSASRLPAPIRIGGVVRWRIGEINEWIASGCPEIGRPAVRQFTPKSL